MAMSTEASERCWRDANTLRLRRRVGERAHNVAPTPPCRKERSWCPDQSRRCGAWTGKLEASGVGSHPSSLHLQPLGANYRWFNPNYWPSSVYPRISSPNYWLPSLNYWALSLNYWLLSVNYWVCSLNY